MKYNTMVFVNIQYWCLSGFFCFWSHILYYTNAILENQINISFGKMCNVFTIFLMARCESRLRKNLEKFVTKISISNYIILVCTPNDCFPSTTRFCVFAIRGELVKRETHISLRLFIASRKIFSFFNWKKKKTPSGNYVPQHVVEIWLFFDSFCARHLLSSYTRTHTRA